MKKSLEMAFGGTESWVGKCLRESPWQSYSISQVDGDSDMVLTCCLWGDRAQQRNNGFCQHFCLGKSSPPGLALVSDNSVLHIFLEL